MGIFLCRDFKLFFFGLSKKFKIAVLISTILVVAYILFFPKKLDDTKGIEYNEFRKRSNGIVLSNYHENKTFSTDKKGENGISIYLIQKEKEAEFRNKKIAYLQSKCIYFDPNGITEETNTIRKVINDSTEWFMKTSDIYRAKKNIGFLIQMRNNKLFSETELKLNKALRDSVLQSWNFY